MAKLTLLEMVTNILSALDEDDVSNIDDTPSAAQVAEIVKEVYYQFIENDEVPELLQLIRLSAAPGGENALLTIPTNVNELHWIKYNKIKSGATRADFRSIKYMAPAEFIALTDSRNSTASNIEAMTDPTSTDVTIYIENDKAPEWWTSFDDTYITFDSYDSAVDTSGIEASKTKCYAQIVPTWTASNSFTPTLDANKFAYLLAESKAVAFATLNKELPAKIEQISRKQKAKQQNNNHRHGLPLYDLRQPDYGRK